MLDRFQQFSFSVSAADTDGDGVVAINDLIRIRNMILGG